MSFLFLLAKFYGGNFINENLRENFINEVL